MRTSWASLMMAAIVLCGAHAGAQNEAEATRLFAEGQSFVKDGKYEEACTKFEGSLKAGAGVGTMLNLGDCYEHVARPSSAFAMYRGAEALAHVRQDAREATAHELAEKVRSHVSWVVLRFAETRIAGYEVRSDGTLVGDAELDRPIPADPGPHAIEVRALDKQPWRGTFRVVGEGTTVTLDVPRLSDAPKAAPIVITRTSGKTQRLLGVVVGSFGLASIAVGSIFGGVVLDYQSQTTDPNNPAYCNDVAKYCSSLGNQRRNDATNYAHVVDVTMAVGIAAVIGGVIIYLTAPKTQDARASIPRFLPRATGAGVGWTF
jgi:hypothetical protein